MIGFVDCYSGVSGDMLLGAMVDAGVPLDDLRAMVSALAIRQSVRLEALEVHKAGIRAMQVRVVADDHQDHRPFKDVVAIIRDGGLPVDVAETSETILRRIAAIEAQVHGVPVEEIELHEVGAIDSIVDVVCGVAGLRLLGIDRLYASSLPIAPADIRASGHRMPGPAPATLAIIADAGAPTRPFGEGHELVTPTGAAILATLATFRQPPMTVSRVGYGAGSADFEWPNVLRLWIGQPTDARMTAPSLGDHVVLETNVDDMSPQLLAPIGEQLFAAGALDVTLTPMLMKKGRLATTIGVIGPIDAEARLADVLLRETSTLGVRVHDVRRYEADRRFETVSTPFGSLTVKVKVLGGVVVGATPEFESVREAARLANVPLQRVANAAAAAAEALLPPVAATT